MSGCHYVKDLPGRIRLSEPPLHKPFAKGHRREVQLSQQTFESLADYTRSSPTAASPGRIYRKNLGWPKEMPDNWFIYLVVSYEDDVIQVPYSVVIVP